MNGDTPCPGARLEISIEEPSDGRIPFHMSITRFIVMVVGVVAVAACATTVDTPKQPVAEGEASETEERSADAEIAGPYSYTIRWATASEVDNFGFNVYRGLEDDGPFTRVNSGIITGAGTSDIPHRYEFVDEEIDPYEVYYYYVESVALDGTTEQFTPVAEVGPKIERSENR